MIYLRLNKIYIELKYKLFVRDWSSESSEGIWLLEFFHSIDNSIKSLCSSNSLCNNFY